MKIDIPRLWGIGDPVVRRQLLSQCASKVQLGHLALILILGACGMAVAGAIVLHFRLTFWWRIPVYGAASFGAVGVAAAWHHYYRVRRLLPRMLRELGRCERCGYDLRSTGTVRCPECGAPSDAGQLGQG